MTTYNLSANTNLSSLGSGGPVAGDIVNVGAWTLTIDTSSTWTFAQLNFTNVASRLVTASGVTATLNVTISSSASLTASPITLATGQSLTINGFFNSWGTAGSVISIVTISGGVFVLNAGSATTQIYQGTTGTNPNLITQTGGTITVTGAITLSYTSGSQSQYTSSAGSVSHTGNITITGNANTLGSTQQILNFTGSATFTLNGNFTTSGTIYSGFGPILCGGGSVTATINGNVAIDGAGANGNLGVNVTTSGAQCTINGNLLASSGAAAATVSAGTLFWGGTRTIASGQMSLVNCLGTGTLNIDSLILSNSGMIAIIRTQTGTITSNGTTAINNLLASSGAAVIGAAGSVPITNTPSTVGYMPTAGQVQNGVSFGYSSSMLTGTGATINEAAIGAALAAAVVIPTVSQIASYLIADLEATIIPVNVTQAQGTNIAGTAGYFQMDMAQSLPTAPAANSVGEALFIDDLFGGRANTAQGGTSTTITLDSGASSDATAYVGDDIYLYAGTGGGVRGSGQRRTIVAYNTTSKVATVSRAWDTTPDATTKFITLPQPQSNLGMIQSVQIATPAAAGILDVNVKNIAGQAAQLDGNNLLKVDLVDILGTMSKGAAGYVGIDISQTANNSATIALPNVTIGTVTQLTDAPSVPTTAQIASAVAAVILINPSEPIATDSAGRVLLQPNQTAVTITNYVTIPAAVAVASQSPNVITCLRGDTLRISLPQAGDISSRSKLVMTAKANLNDTDDLSVIQIIEGVGLVTLNGSAADSPTSASLTVGDATTGSINLVLAANATAQLSIRDLVWDVQAYLEAGIATPINGMISVVADVTQAVT